MQPLLTQKGQTLMDDAEYESHKTRLTQAIAAFFEATHPGDFVDAWVLATHRQSIELEQRGQSVVGLLVPSGQSFPMTRGLLEVALDAERA